MRVLLSGRGDLIGERLEFAQRLGIGARQTLSSSPGPLSFTLGQISPPTLRNVAETAPYMHAGQFDTLKEVLNHYNRAVSGTVGHIELDPLDLSEAELAQLEAFLRSLSGPLAVAPEWLRPPQ